MGQLILNVDDFEPQRYARSSILRAAGFTVLEAATGRDAVALVREHRPDLVLLDMHLPDIDGLAVCRAIKDDPATCKCLVLHISATFRDAASRTAALNNGADAYLTESVEADELVAQVRALLRLASAEAEAHRAQEALRDRETRFRSLFEHMSEGFFLAEIICDGHDRPVDYRYLEVNAAFERLTGLKREETIGRTQRELLPGAEPEWVETYGRVALTGRPESLEAFAAPLGRHFGTIAYSPAPGQFACLFRDMTGWKQAEAAFRASEERARRRAEEFEKLMELVPAAIWVASDPECQTIIGNRTANRFYEASGQENVSAGRASGGAQDLTRRFFSNGVELPPEALPMQAAAATGQEVRDSELDVLLPSGRTITILGSATPLFDADGRVRGCIAAFIDISERKRIERALRESEATFRTVVEHSRDGINLLDLGTRHYVFVSGRQAEMTGVPVEELRGASAEEIFARVHPDDRALAVGQVEQIAAGQEGPGTVEYRWRVGSGAYRWFSDSRKLARDDHGRPAALVGVLRDITDRKEAEAALREALEGLRRANRIKDEFLATLSHELRTPLTAILGWGHLLERGGLDEATVRQGLQAIVRNADVQRQLVSDILDVSRMMSGKLRLDVTVVDLVEILRLAIASARPALEAKSLQLEFAADTAPALVTADTDRLQQVFWNLLSNAAKFTEPGGRVSVRVRRGDDAIEVVVSDTGVGIPPSFLPHVFDRFTQADGSISRRFGGLGLGLSIVRQLVEMHGGRVYAASDGEGRGATFRVTLPLRADAPAEIVTAGAAPVNGGVDLRGLRVLILDDLEDARALLRTVIERAGGRPFLASCGADALVGLPLTRPDVILADLGMPDMDGYEFLRRVRALPAAAGGRVPVVAVTAYGSGADRDRALAAGFAAHLGKPVLPDDVLNVVSRVAQVAG